jgi:hypothetical protein
MMRDHNVAGAAIAGMLMLGVPLTDLLMGGSFGGVHAVLGTTGLALLVVTLLGGEA